MEMHPVQSTNIKEIGHDGVSMRIRFTNGKTYAYVGVMADLFAEFRKSESPGKFFASRIRPVFDGVLIDGGLQSTADAPKVTIL